MKDIVIMPKQSELIYDCYFKIEEMVLLCVITAIDNAMTEKGENWFANFKSAEANESKPVISDKEDKHFSNICDLDFQAAIKCLAFRKKYFSAVWEKYGIDKDKSSDFTALLFRLIKNRNDVSGHFDVKSILSKYSEVDSEEARRLVLKFRGGILDFISLLNYFPDICDANGNTYLSLAEEKYAKTEKLFTVFGYDIEETIQREGMGIDATEFERLCKRVGVGYYSDDDGKSYFETENYKKTVKSIKALIEEIHKNPVVLQEVAPETINKSNNGVKYLIVGAAVVILILLVALLAMAFSGNDKDKQNQSVSDTGLTSAIEEVIEGFEESDTQNSAPQSVAASSQEEKEDVITGQGRLGGLTVKVDTIPSQYLTFEYENGDGNAYSFGWVNQVTQVIIETSSGKFYGSVSGSMVKMAAESEGTFNVSVDKEITGKIKKITITNILPLNDVGLPLGSSLTLRIPIKYK